MPHRKFQLPYPLGKGADDSFRATVKRHADGTSSGWAQGWPFIATGKLGDFWMLNRAVAAGTLARIRIASALMLGAALAIASLPTPASTTVNLNKADIQVLIKTVSEVTGKNFLVDPTVHGEVTIISATPMNADALYQAFLSSLAVLGYVAIPDGKVVKIVPENNGRFDAADRFDSRDEGVVTTKVFQLQQASASTVANLLKSFAPPWAQVIPGPNNSIVVADRSNNIDRFERMIRELDQSADLDSESVELKAMSAAEAARMLTQYLQQARTPEAPPSTASVMADERSNRLVVIGSRSERERMIRLLSQLDSPAPTEASSTQIIYLKHAQADQLLPSLEGLAQKYRQPQSGPGNASPASALSLVANKAANALILSAGVEASRELRSAIEQLDVRRAQVVVEVLVAEISRTRSEEVGVNWALIDNNRIAFASILNPSVLSALQSLGGGTGSSNPGGAVELGATVAGGTINRNGTSLGAVLKALRGDGKTNILSSPSIVTLDNEEAQVVVGQEVPFITGSFNSSSAGGNTGANPFQTIERKDVGIKLSVTPQINTGETVLLKLKLEVSSLASAATGAADLITNKRSLSNAVSVEDGQILVLGGLVDDSTDESRRGVPLLSSIPLLGGLFRSSATASTKRNLMVFLSPHILRSTQQADYYTQKKYQQLELLAPRQAALLRGSLGVNPKKSETIPTTELDVVPETKASVLDGVKTEAGPAVSSELEPPAGPNTPTEPEAGNAPLLPLEPPPAPTAAGPN